MFTFTETASHNDFIQRIDRGVLTQHPEVHVCQVAFNLAAFNEEAFHRYGVISPPQLATAVAKRKAEYLAGRYCCAQLLAAKGAPTQVASGADRAPCWPAGFNGAISHCRGQAIALLARCEQGWPGIDIENFNADTLRESADLITTPAERARLRGGPLEYELALLLAFSAKESLYKALYPQVQRFFDFHSASILSIDPQRGHFLIALTQDLTPQLRQGFSVTGSYRFEGNTMTTLLLA